MTSTRRPSRISADAEAAAASCRSETRKRSEQVLVRFTPDELVAAQSLAERIGSKSIPELLRLGLLVVMTEEARNAV